jgi:predicted acetyltransferase
VAYSIDPRWINVAPTVAPARGSFREASKDELPLLQSIYREFSAPRNGFFHRAPIVWEGQVLGTGPQMDGPVTDAGPSLIAVYEEGGEPQGYVTYAAKWYPEFSDNAGAGQRLFVRDYAYKTPAAYRAMWDMFKQFDLVTRVTMEKMPTDDPAFDILLDPRELHATRFDWLLGRLIDVERALPLRPYGAEGRVVFELQDQMCPWNAGRWALEAGPEGSAIARTKDSPHLALDVSSLAQLLFGQVSPTQAVRNGRAEASPGAPLPLWDAMFRTEYAPFCPDGF